MSITRMDDLVTSLKSAADKIIGKQPRGRPKEYCNDNEIIAMSNNRQKLLQKLKQSNTSENRKSLRSEINKLKNLISKRFVIC